MTEREMALIEFIETRLESMLSRPEVWGSNLGRGGCVTAPGGPAGVVAAIL